MLATVSVSLGRYRARSVALIAAALLLGCGGGGGGGSSPPQPSAAVLQSISLTPAVPAAALGTTLALTATGKYSDGSTQPLNASAAWTSSDPRVATVADAGSKGVVTAVSAGMAEIRASVNGVSASVNFRSGNALLNAEIMSVRTLVLSRGATWTYSVLGHFGDTSRNVTAEMTWSSSNPAIATVSNAAGSQGRITAIAPGTTMITGTLDGVIVAQEATVSPAVAFDPAAASSQAPGMGAVGIDANGNALAVWHYRFNTGPDTALFTSQFKPALGWSPKAALPTLAGRFASNTTMAMNANGDALVAWRQLDGIYVSRLVPGSGMQTARKIISQQRDDILHLEVAIDAAGNGMLTWMSDDAVTLPLFSRFSIAADSWSAPVPVPGVARTGWMLLLTKMVMNPAGEAAMVYSRMNGGLDSSRPTGENEVGVARFAPGNGATAGWQSPDTLFVSYSPQQPTVAIGDSGKLTAAVLFWPSTPTVPGDPTLGSLSARQYIPGSGWQATAPLLLNSTRMPVDLRAAANSNGAVLTIRNALDSSIAAFRFDPTGGWQAPVDMYSPAVWASGDPTLLQPFMAENGRIVVTWLIEDNFDAGKFAMARYVPGTGWEPGTTPFFIGRHGRVSGIDVAFNRNGKGAVFWQEFNASNFDFSGYAELTY